MSFCLPFFLDYEKVNNPFEDNQVYLKFENNNYLSKIENVNKFAVYRKFENHGWQKYRFDFLKFTEIDNFDSEEVYVNPYIILYKTFKICKERGAF